MSEIRGAPQLSSTEIYQPTEGNGDAKGRITRAAEVAKRAAAMLKSMFSGSNHTSEQKLRGVATFVDNTTVQRAAEEAARPKTALERYQDEAAKIRERAMISDPKYQKAQKRAYERITGKPSDVFYSVAPSLSRNQLDKINEQATALYRADISEKELLIRSIGIHDQAYQTEYFRLTASGMSAEKASVLAKEVAGIKVCGDASTRKSDLGLAVDDMQNRLDLTRYAAEKFVVMNNPSYMPEFQRLIEEGVSVEDAQTLAFEHTKVKLSQNTAMAA